MRNINKAGILGLIFTTMAFLSACSQAPATVERKEQVYFGRQGATKIVRAHKSQTLTEFAHANGASATEVAKANNLSANAIVSPGQALKVPYHSGSAGIASGYSDAASSDVAISAEPLVGTHTQSGLTSPHASHDHQHNLASGNDIKPIAGRQPRTLEEQLSASRKQHSPRPLNETKKAAASKQHAGQGKPLPQDIEQQIAPDSSDYLITEEMPSELQEAESTQEIKKSEPATQSHSTSKPSNTSSGAFKLATPLGDARFMWPLHGKILTRFKEGVSEGINIEGQVGSNVLAAADGEVVYVGQDMEEYGNMLIIQHADNIFTAYAHNNKLTVRAKEKVRKGQILGQVGQTGNVNAPQLYFSIRKDDNTVDPEQPLGKDS